MNMVSRFFRWLISLLFTVIAPVIIMIVGALTAGFGLQEDWQWLVYGGGIVVVIGAILFLRIWVDWE